jgi:hypothetical protein
MYYFQRLFITLAVVVVVSLCAIPAWGGPIRSFTDKQGVIHIGNVGKPDAKEEAKTQEEPAAEKVVPPAVNQEAPGATPPKIAEVPAASPGQDNPTPEPQGQAEKPPVPSGKEHPEEASSVKGIQAIDPNSQEADPFLSPVRFVACRKPGPEPQVTERAPQARREGAILVYRDGRGVLHIESTGVAETPGPRPHAPEEVMAVRPLTPKGAPTVLVHPDRLPSLQQVAWSDQPLLPPRPRTLQATKAISLSESETIRRYRDARGVLHITNEGTPEPPNGPPAGWAGGRGVTPVSFLAGIREGPGPPEASRPPPQGAKVVAGRDRQGRLTIHSVNPETKVAAGPPPQTMAALAPIIVEASQSYGLPAPLILALIRVESNFVPQAVSPKGAMGLMQLMPGTADSLGVKDAFCARENVMAGCRYLRWLLNTFNGSLPLGLAAYNAGHQRVINAGFRVPDIKETQEFVTRVLEGYNESMPGGRWATRY